MEFKAIVTATGKPWKKNGKDVIFYSEDYTLRTSHSLNVAVSEITLFSDDFEAALDAQGLFSSLGLTILWKIDNNMHGGIVTGYTLSRNYITLEVSSPQFLFDKELLTSFSFEETNPRRVTINRNFNSEFAYRRSGKPAQLLAIVAAVKSPIPATSDTFSQYWGGATTGITIDPVNLLTTKEVLEKITKMQYCPLVNWTYIKYSGEDYYKTIMSYAIDSEYTTADKYVFLNAWLPNDFTVKIDNSNLISTGWCVSKVGNTNPEQYLYGRYDHAVSDAEPLKICAKVQVDDLTNGDECIPYARALEEGFSLFEFKVTVPTSERVSLEDAPGSTAAREITSLNYACFKDVLTTGDTVRGIITETELTSETVTYTISKALYRPYEFTHNSYTSFIAESLTSSKKKDLFGAIAANSAKIAQSNKLTP